MPAWVPIEPPFVETENTEYLYRYEEVRYLAGLNDMDDPLPGYTMKVELRKYRIIKKTPKGAWISFGFFGDPKNKKFVLLKSARKKFACSTAETDSNTEGSDGVC